MVTITTINIADGQTAVTPTIAFVVVFSAALDSTSVNGSTVTLYDNKIGQTVDITTTLSSNTLTIRPNKLLRENRSYTLTLVGKLTSTITNSRYLKVSSSNYLAETETFTFTTGTVTETTSITSPTDLPDSVGFIETELYEDLDSDLDIDYISPSPTGYAIPRSTSLITFTFSESVPEQDDNVTVTVKPVLNNTDYLALDNSAGDGYVYHYNDRQDASYDWTLPTAITEWSGQYLYVYLSSEDGLISADNKMPYGTTVVVEFSSSLSSDAGNLLNTSAEYEFIFEAAPCFGTVDSIKFDLIFSTLPTIPDKLVYKLLLKYSNDLARRRTSLTKYSWSIDAQTYVEANATLYLLQRALMQVHLYGRKTRETLGDLTMEYSDRDFLNSVDGMTYAKELRDKIKWANMSMSSGPMVTGILRQNSPTFQYLYTRQPRTNDYEAGDNKTTMGQYADESSYNSWPFLSESDLGY